MQENFGRQEQHLEQHYNDVLQTLSQRYDERAAGLEEEKKAKLEALYNQLLSCGQAIDASKELIEAAQEVYRLQDKRLFLKVVVQISVVHMLINGSSRSMCRHPPDVFDSHSHIYSLCC